MTIPFTNSVLEHQRGRLLALLRALSYQQREITLSSGKKSNFYIDCKQTALSAEGHVLIGQLLSASVAEICPEAEAVGGLTIGADPLVSATATMSFLGGRPLQGFLIRKDPKKHGTEQYVEGMANLRAGMPVVLLEDVVTTGASTLRAFERGQSAGLDVRHVVALVDRQEGGRDAVEKHVPLTALYSKSDFIS
jgi:orotate phosphoribosyltransferase